jgi:Leucine-rich repeat (LRR) protein
LKFEYELEQPHGPIHALTFIPIRRLTIRSAMENQIQHQKSRDPEADTFFLGRSIVEEPEFNEPPGRHESSTPPAGTFAASQFNVNMTSESPNRRDVTISEHVNVPVDEEFLAPIRDVSNNAKSRANNKAEVLAVRSPRTNRTTIILAAFGICAIIAAMVVLGVCFSGDCGSKNNNKVVNPTAPPMDVTVERVVAAFVNNISYMNQEILVNGTTAESRALTWIIQNDTLFNKSNLLTLNSFAIDNEVSRRVRQRYSLYTFWFQQVDEAGEFVNSWTNTSGWLQVENECNWTGIFCDENGSVNQIFFYNYSIDLGNNFVGSIPPDIGLLTSLRNFSLRSSDVTGTIPESIGQCSQMFIFDISNCSVTGTLPSSLGQWTDLYFLDVSVNKITGTLPSLLGQWTEIYGFDVSKNNITGTLPSLLGQWTDIHGFDVSENNITGTLPSLLGQWTNIMFFDISSNKITGTIPDSAASWTNISSIDVSNNTLSGSIPSFISQWTHLARISLGFNQFTNTIPEDIGILTDIYSLRLTNNSLSGTLPSSIGRMTNLVWFYVGGNNLTGTIPSSIGNWSQIYTISFRSNGFTGSLPPSLGRMTELKYFYVNDNRLIGTIPSSIGNWSWIRDAWFESNDFTGTMPTEICDFIEGNDTLQADCNINCSCCTSCL